MGKRKTAMPDGSCFCGGPSYAACCGRFLEGDALPETPGELMRSRYSAYVLRNEPYLLRTWCERTRPTPPLLEEPAPQWRGLDIIRETVDGDDGTVEFIARYKTNGRAQALHEISRFLREHGQGGKMTWCYVNGTFP